MSSQVMFSNSEAPRPSSHVRTFANDSQQYIHYLANMIHAEPVIERCLDAITSNTLMKGISCFSEDGAKMATSEFSTFVNEEYGKFAREAIRMFYILGFVVWRIRRKQVREKVQSVPEVLPLGTFSWSVQVRGKDEYNNKRRREEESLLYYDIQLNGIDCEYYVYEFVTPDLTMECLSPLSTVISHFIRLQVARACKTRSDEWNSSTKMAVEHNEKMLVNQLADDGQVLQSNSAMNSQFDALYEDGLSESTESRAGVIREQAQRAGFPATAHTFVIPKNHTVRALDSVDSPNGMPDAEMEFQRSVCYSMGVPCNLVIQNYTMGQNSSSSKSGSELTTQSTQMLQNTCMRLAKHLCLLLNEVYEMSFRVTAATAKTDEERSHGKTNRVRFEINCSPIMELADIVELHFRHLVDDKVISEMLVNTIGFPLNYFGCKRLPWNKTVQEPQKPENKAGNTQAQNAKKKKTTSSDTKK